MRVIDLRSDTVTQPSRAMREAMASAPVGDDVYGEDPTVRRLEEAAAGRLGKEAALFVPSGTMANQAALRLLTRPGEVVLTSESSHIQLYEGGAAWALSGLHLEAIGKDGFFEVADVRGALPPDDEHCARVVAVAFENTHNAAGGLAWSPEELRKVAAGARACGLALHLDGARLFNAAVATGVDPASLAAPFDTVSICLSKGLGAPIGSLVCSDEDRVRELRRIRKMLGGGMRQAGIIAAGGLYALEHNVERLKQDHENARRLCDGLREHDIEVARTPETNMVFFRPPSEMGGVGGVSRALRKAGVLINPSDRERLRAVTHLDVSYADIDEALSRIASVLNSDRHEATPSDPSD